LEKRLVFLNISDQIRIDEKRLESKTNPKLGADFGNIADFKGE